MDRGAHASRFGAACPNLAARDGLVVASGESIGMIEAMTTHSAPTPGPTRDAQEILLLELVDALLRLDPEPLDAFDRDLDTFDRVAAAPGDFMEMIDPHSARSQLAREQPRLRMLLAILRGALEAADHSPAPGEHTVRHYYRRAVALVTETQIGAPRYARLRQLANDQL